MSAIIDCKSMNRLRSTLGFMAGGEVTHTKSGNFTAPIVSTDYCFDHRNQDPETLVKPTTECGSLQAEEVIIIICHIIIIIITVVIIVAS